MYIINNIHMTFLFFFFRLALEKDEIPESKSEEAWKGNQKAQLSTWCIRPYGFMSRNIAFKTTYVPFIVCFGTINPCFLRIEFFRLQSPPSERCLKSGWRNSHDMGHIRFGVVYRSNRQFQLTKLMNSSALEGAQLLSFILLKSKVKICTVAPSLSMKECQQLRTR